MAKYVIGDIHGCGDELEELIHQLSYNPSQDQIYLIGDLVGKGPQALKVFEIVMKLDLPIVGGNGDIHVLACMLDCRNSKKKDHIYSLLKLPIERKQQIIDGLLKQQFVIDDPNFMLVHASVHPCHTHQQIMELNELATNFIRKHAVKREEFKKYFNNSYIEALEHDCTFNIETRHALEAVLLFTINRQMILQQTTSKSTIFRNSSAIDYYNQYIQTQKQLASSTRECINNYSNELNYKRLTSSKISDFTCSIVDNLPAWHTVVDNFTNYSTFITEYTEDLYFLDLDPTIKGLPVVDFATGRFPGYMGEEFKAYIEQNKPGILKESQANLHFFHQGKPIFFGHGSMLNQQTLPPGYICTDTSCVYGESLTAYQLPETQIDINNAKALMELAQPIARVYNKKANQLI